MSLKDEALGTENEDISTFELTEGELNYLRLLNLGLQFHTLGQKIMSGFMYYVATTRLGYKPGSNLQFEIDLNKDDGILTVKLLPADFGQPQPPEQPAPGPAPAA
jgi:hypothetical protein